MSKGAKNSNHKNETSRIVGGYVRDYLRNIETKDIDIATKLIPDEVIELLSKEKIKTVPTGLSCMEQLVLLLMIKYLKSPL